MEEQELWQRREWTRGRDLLRAGDFWEAHEAWEEVWKSQPQDSSARSATQALIQFAAIAYKPTQARRGRPEHKMQRGMSQLLITCRDHLEAATRGGPPEPEWNLAALQSALEAAQELLDTWRAGQSLETVCVRVTELARNFADEIDLEPDESLH